jgi:RND family efflux transporter MFP subunit
MNRHVVEAEELDSTFSPQATRPHKRRGYLLAIALGIVFLIIAAVGILSRFSEKRALANETEQLALATVSVVHPKAEPPQEQLILPSTLQAFTESPIYARTNGYLKKWYRDIGSAVHQGELLADIETPEIDQELLQAKAARDQAAAQVQIAETSAKRWETLQKMDAVAQQETDERSSSYTQAKANMAAAEANVHRLAQLESFKHIYAPFSGVITRRNVDIGALINAGNTGPNQQLFNIARIDPIRVYVSVPEIYAPSVRPGVHSKIELASISGKTFTGNVVRTADSIDPTTRTLLTEIDVPNPKGELLPGAFAQVHFALNVQVPRLSVPVNALLFRAEGVRAAVVDGNGKVDLKPVSIGRDYGRDVEVLSGLQSTDSLVLNPPDSLESGQQVSVKQAGAR